MSQITNNHLVQNATNESNSKKQKFYKIAATIRIILNYAIIARITIFVYTVIAGVESTVDYTIGTLLTVLPIFAISQGLSILITKHQ